MKKFEIELEEGTGVPLYRCNTVIVGSGAAGLNCAERLLNAGVLEGPPSVPDLINRHTTN